MVKYYKILFVLFIILGIFTIQDFVSRLSSSSDNISLQKDDTSTDLTSEKEAQIYFSDKVIYAEIADTPYKKELGLSFRDSLDENKGMLFIFDEPTITFFWMKDMHISLDIIWIMDNKIVDIDKNVPTPKADTPLIQLPKYSPSEKVNYVLEVNAGFADKNNIETGDTALINF